MPIVSFLWHAFSSGTHASRTLHQVDAPTASLGSNSSSDSIILRFFGFAKSMDALFQHAYEDASENVLDFSAMLSLRLELATFTATGAGTSAGGDGLLGPAIVSAGTSTSIASGSTLGSTLGSILGSTLGSFFFPHISWRLDCCGGAFMDFGISKNLPGGVLESARSIR